MEQSDRQQEDHRSDSVSEDESNVDGEETEPVKENLNEADTPVAEPQPLRRSARVRSSNYEKPYSLGQWGSRFSKTNWETSGVIQMPIDQDVPPDSNPAQVTNLVRRESLKGPRGNFGMVSRLNLKFREWEMVALMASSSHESDPASLNEALTSKEAEKWRKAADDEYASLMKNRRWELEKLLPGCKAITGRKAIINGCSGASTLLMVVFPGTRRDWWLEGFHKSLARTIMRPSHQS